MHIEWNKVTWYSKIAAVLLGIGIFALGIYFGEMLKDSNEYQDATVQDSINAAVQKGDENTLLSDFSHISRNVLDYYNNGDYVAYAREPDDRKIYSPFGAQNSQLEDINDLVILDTTTGKRRVFDTYLHLAPSSTLAFLKNNTDDSSMFNIDVTPVAWSPSETDTVWARVALYSDGDPRINNAIAYSKINPNNGAVSFYPLPSHDSFGSIQENMNSGDILYEAFDNGALSLYLYNFKTQQEKSIVHYSKHLFDMVCDSQEAYLYGDSTDYGTCGYLHGLMPTWDIDVIQYHDLITRALVTVKTTVQ